MQQDEEDWRHEASRLSLVYSNSSLNIAAADSPNGDIGCFFDKRSDFPNPWKVTFPQAGPVLKAKRDWGTKERTRHFTWNCVNRTSTAVIEDSHMATRAWTFQERLMSPRTCILAAAKWPGNAVVGLLMKHSLTFLTKEARD